MSDNSAFIKAARAAAGLPEPQLPPDPEKDQKTDDQKTDVQPPDAFLETVRAAAGLPPTIPVESTRKG